MGKRESYGKQDWLDGSRYEGKWKDGRVEGHGKLYHGDGDIYKGEWADDKANGHEYILMQMEQNILESGKTTSNTVKDMKHCLMEPFIKVSTAMGRNTVTDDFNLLMDRCTPEPSV